MPKVQAISRTGAAPHASGARWLKQFLLVLLLLAGLGLALAPIGRLLETPITEVVLEGRLNPMAEESIREVLEALPGTPFLRLGAARLRHRIENLPWVSWVQVRREWPGRLLVTVEQQVAVARWGDDGLLNARGEVFRPRMLPQDASLARLSGPDAVSGRTLEGYLQLRDLADKAGLRLAGMEVSPRRSWSVTLVEGPRVELGRERQLARFGQLLQAFGTVLRDYRDRMVKIDLRYANGFAVDWRQERPAEPHPAVNKRTARATSGITGKSIS